MKRPKTPEAVNPIKSELARLRAKHHLSDAAGILTDATPYIRWEERTMYAAIVDELQRLERQLDELAPNDLNFFSNA